MNSLSLNQIAYNILNDLRGGRSSHNDHIPIEQIKTAVKYWRAMLIRRDQYTNNNRFRMFEQDLGHITVEKIDSADDPSIKSGEIVVRTTNKIPTPVRLKDSEAITFIGHKDKAGEPIPLLDDQRAYWEQFSKYSKNKTFASYRDGYIYIHNDISLDNINVRGIFEDPAEVFEFTDSGGIDFYDANEPFPISSDMINTITKGLISEELAITVESPNDTELDTIQDK